MKGKLSSIIVCLGIAIWLLISGNPLYLGIGVSLLAAVVVLAVDIVFTTLYHYSLLSQVWSLHRLKTYRTEEEAFCAVFDHYKKEGVLQSAIFVGYTADMQARDLQHYIHQNRINLEELKILIKHPASIAESVIVNNIPFPAFPRVDTKIQNRRNEVNHSLNEIKGLVTKGFVQTFEARGYYSLPSIRAVVINKEYGYLSLYIRHTTGDDLTGTTRMYMRMSNCSRIERELLMGFLEWFALAWHCSSVIGNTNY